MIGMYQTVRPDQVGEEMDHLAGWYFRQEANVTVLAEFHARYESIHPLGRKWQDWQAGSF